MQHCDRPLSRNRPNFHYDIDETDRKFSNNFSSDERQQFLTLFQMKWCMVSTVGLVNRALKKEFGPFDIYLWTTVIA